jgi:hypothetical protein
MTTPAATAAETRGGGRLCPPEKRQNSMHKRRQGEDEGKRANSSRIQLAQHEKCFTSTSLPLWTCLPI